MSIKVSGKKKKESVIQVRKYQQFILKKLKENFIKSKHTIAEVDTGLGKRVLMYLLVHDEFPDKRILLLLHSTSSFSETLHYFEKEYGGFHGEEFQGISSRTPTWLRKKILQSSGARIIAATPQTFSNAFEKLDSKPKFDIVIINEVDKVIRRQGDTRILIFPYNKLIPHFMESGSWILGMTGTMRDKHVFMDLERDFIEIRDEYYSLQGRIPNLHILRMDTLLKNSDIRNYIKRTTIKRYPVTPSPQLTEILSLIDEAIVSLREKIIKNTREESPTLLDFIPSSQLALVSGMLESRSGKPQKYQGLLLIRKYCSAMQAEDFKRFLYRLKSFGITKDMINKLPARNAKVEGILAIIQKRKEDSKSVIICSYLKTADKLSEVLNEIGVKTFILTGRVKDKAKVLQSFKESNEKSVLIMTSVGERDIDIPQADLLIVYDSINTTKTMYQRMKRTRGGEVLILYYQDTFEERKVKRLMESIRDKYPWSSIIEG
ncbi:MAG: helicase-related protein [Candidatus Hodarchaeales archaeon]